jgi:UDP-GlcNAc:undecaprenyl-phosphate GlcNAc-1-phosphate transferase
VANPELVSVGISAAAAVGLGLIATAATRASVRKVGFVAKPRADRWHQKPTALAGGIGIFVAFALVVLATSGGIAALSLSSPHVRILAGATAMFALGLVDDIYHLRPYTKLIGQLLVAALTVATGPALPWTPYLLVNQGISVFWIVGLTNALNLLDNMDGLAAGSALVVAAFQAAFFWVGGQPVEAAICAALAGSLLGFLVFNWNPATIFMGDCGSLFLGYTLSVLAMSQSYGRGRGIAAIIVVPVMVMLLPIFDTTFVTITRLLRGKPVSQGGRDHTSHRLVTLGLSERKAVSILLAIGVLGGTVGLSARIGSILGVLVGAPLLLLALVFVAIHLVRGAPVTGETESSGTSKLLLFGQFAYKRRVFEVLLDATLAMVCIIVAFWLRFDGRPPLVTLESLTRLFPLLVAAKVIALLVTGAYGGVWRYVSLTDIWRLMRGAVLGTTLIFAIGTLTHARELARGALIMDGILFAVAVIASRVGFRVTRTWLAQRTSTGVHTPVLLWGAGDAGANLLRRLQEEPERGLVPVGFIDDDANKMGRRIHGLPVLGSSGEIPALIAEGRASLIVVCSTLIPSSRVEAAVSIIGSARVRRVRFELEDAAPVLRTQAH